MKQEAEFRDDAPAASLVRHLWLPLAAYLPVTVVLLAVAILAGGDYLLTALLAIAGFGTWTFFEYWMHRLILHMIPRGRVRRYISGRHILHHRSPLGHPGIVVLWISALVCATTYGALVLALGQASAAAVMAGIVFGYLAYEYTHLANHLDREPAFPWGAALRQHHLAHHDDDPRTNYAILLPFWDAVFRTRL